ncbi:Tryptophan aminotransferase-related protein 2 [Acorus gramineus]|uniref:Tryptophan aminotransferase-related protein 2 n=1 Tax=Acorus gramineus TaxID=55184 RepID=A0AAV9AZF0_ACOGR|nr:Tryptophan aminotransferase-related protein 2 [Acorus gramineus]
MADLQRGFPKMAKAPRFIMGLIFLASLALNLIDLERHLHRTDVSTSKGVCLEAEAEHLNHMAAPAEHHIRERRIGGSALSSDSVVNLDHGDPTMFESFWRTVGERSTIVIPGWKTMSYFSDVRSVCWFLETEFADEVRRLHRLVGNAKVDDGRSIVVGTGSTQLFQAALYALSPLDGPEPVNVVSAVPYYSSYPAVTDFLKSRLYKWAGDACGFPGDDSPYIELVTSPNNPDGFTRKAIVNGTCGKTVHDLAYYWPQYTAITEEADHDIMLFTVSKSTGHAGTRIGWALVKDEEVAKRMTKFIELNTIGVSKDSQLRAARILKAISDGHEWQVTDGTERFFEYGRRMMTDRWERLRVVVRSTGRFSLPEFTPASCKFAGETTETHPAFAWLKCEMEGVEDCESYLKSHKILTRSGKHFGVDIKHVRVSMLDKDEIFDLFLERLANL